MEFHANSDGNFKQKITRFMQTTPNAIFLLIIKRFPNHKNSRKKTHDSHITFIEESLLLVLKF